MADITGTTDVEYAAETSDLNDSADIVEISAEDVEDVELFRETTQRSTRDRGSAADYGKSAADSSVESAADLMDSAAESGQKRKRGRPRLDSMPPGTKTENSRVLKTPRPPYNNYYTEAPGDQRKPAAAVEWVTKLPEWVKKRLVVYVYRLWPLLVATQDTAGAAGVTKSEYAYIDVIAGEDFITNITDLMDRYGAGDYKLIVNDDLVEKSTLMTVNVREHWRDLRQHPPTDRRIDNVENVEMSDPSNKSYIEYLKSRGKLPEQQMSREREADMAEATAVREVTGMMGKMLDKAMDNNKGGSGGGPDPAVSKTLEVMAAALQNAYASMGAAKEDPMIALNRMVDVMQKLKPEPKVEDDKNKKSDNSMLSELMEMNRTLSTTITNMQNERLAQSEKMLGELLQKAANPQPTAAAGSGIDQLMGDMEKIAKMRELLGVGEGGGGKESWIDNLPALMRGFGTILNNGVVAYQTYVMAQQMRVNPNYAPNMPQAAKPEEPAAEQEIAPTGQALQAAENPGPGGLLWFLSTIERPFIRFFSEGRGGVAFAEVLVDDIHDRATYDSLVENGPEVMKQTLMNYPGTARILAGKERVLDKFIEEFMSAGKLMDEGADEGSTE